MGIRRKGREVALQTLYSLSYLDMADISIQEQYLNNYQEKIVGVISDMNIRVDSKILTFAEDILRGLISDLDSIDEEIRKHSSNWPIENIAEVDKSILRIAVYELLFTNTPSAIIMNEAIEISKKFCSESSGKFINGILNAVSEGKNEK